MNAALAGAAALLAVLCWAGGAAAYRPFDATDAAVTGAGEFELELGPTGLLREGSEHTLVAPALVLNLGLAEHWEGVLQGQAQTALSPASTGTSLVGNGAFLKGVLREGVLQEKPGPSFATELGLLLPGINDEPGIGGSVAAILSYRLADVTAHLNAQAAVTRQQHDDMFLSTIVEGPVDWPIRPVAEIAYEREGGRSETVSGLLGAIWPAGEHLAFDVGVREGRINDRSLTEIRIGLTVGFRLWGVARH